MSKKISVPQVDHKAIFERAAGHPAEPQTRVVICGIKPKEEPMDETRTLSGKPKPGTFSPTQVRHREQFFI